MVKNNKKVTSHPVPRRTKGGVVRTNEGGHAGTIEGGRQEHVIKQPHMPADTQSTSKNPPTQDKTQHARDRSHGDRTCAQGEDQRQTQIYMRSDRVERGDSPRQPQIIDKGSARAKPVPTRTAIKPRRSPRI